MRRIRICLSVAVVMALVCDAVAQAKPSPGNAAATHVYLFAKYRLEAAFERNIPAGLQLAREYGQRFEQECGDVLAGAPKLRVEEPTSSSLALGPKPALEFNLEALGTAVQLLAEPTIPAARRFVRQVRHLRWSDRALTKSVHTLADRDTREADEPIPDLCADAKLWAASGFQEVSPATQSYWRDHEGGDEEAEGERISKAIPGPRKSISQRLERFEDPADRRLALRLRALEKQTNKKLSQAAAASNPT